MNQSPNALRWDGAPGHYEVYYLSLTDRQTGTGAWIRYTMLAPETGGEASASLWFMAMDGRAEGENLGRKADFPIGELVAKSEPFSLRIGEAELTDQGMSGSFDDVAWDLSWTPRLGAYRHVHPVLERARIAKTVLLLPHPDLEVSGTLTMGDRHLEVEGARGGQAHLWGSKHALRWAWVHCNELEGLDGSPRPDAFLDGVSVFVPRLGREVGPNTPIVGRFDGEDFCSTSPARVLRNHSHFALSSWSFEAQHGARRITGTVDAPRSTLVGVTYHDPDGDEAYCYNSEVASMRLQVWHRSGSHRGWSLADTLVAPGTAHFEYAQREALPEPPLLVA